MEEEWRSELVYEAVRQYRMQDGWTYHRSPCDFCGMAMNAGHEIVHIEKREKAIRVHEECLIAAASIVEVHDDQKFVMIRQREIAAGAVPIGEV